VVDVGVREEGAVAAVAGVKAHSSQMVPIDWGSWSKTLTVPHVIERVKLDPPTLCSKAATTSEATITATVSDPSAAGGSREQLTGGAVPRGAQLVADGGRLYWNVPAGPEIERVHGDAMTVAGNEKSS